jgi:hypothetical protein
MLSCVLLCVVWLDECAEWVAKMTPALALARKICKKNPEARSRYKGAVPRYSHGSCATIAGMEWSAAPKVDTCVVLAAGKPGRPCSKREARKCSIRAKPTQ